MAKMTRTELKGIVKECLVELLAEGLDSTAKSTLSESRKRKSRTKSIQMEEARLEQHRKKLETRVASTVSNVTDDPILQSILADTAKTTLQEQIINDRPGQNSASNLQGVGDVAPSSAGINLDSIFNEPKTNWATLAFRENKTE